MFLLVAVVLYSPQSLYMFHVNIVENFDLKIMV
jgi:hypothetical protein